MLRTAIPSYRLPKDVVDRDIKNVTALGVEIKTGHRVTSLPDLKQQGFNAILLAAGASDENRLDIEGHDLNGVMGCMEFLRELNIGNMPDVKNKTVMVVGGGNSAMDPARAAIRMGASKVIINYRRGREEMPAHDWEIQGAVDEGVELMLMSAPKRFLRRGGKLSAVECISMELGASDESGRRRPVPIKGSEKVVPVDIVVLAIGLVPSTADFPAEMKNGKGLLIADPQTCQTADPDVFACGDCVTAPTMIINAIGQGRRAAFFLDRHVKGESLNVPFDGLLEKTDKAVVLEEAEAFRRTPACPTAGAGARSTPEVLRMLREGHDGGGGAARGPALHELWGVLPVHGMCQRLRSQLYRLHPEADAHVDQCGRGGRFNRLPDPRPGNEGTVRLRQISRRDQWTANGPAAGADAPLQCRVAAVGR